jgi:hypothetical protein
MLGRKDRGLRSREQGRRLSIESLEPRLALTWTGVPPATVTLPVFAEAVTLNSQGDASGSSSIDSIEIEYYSFTANSSGSYLISATTPASNLDPVIALYFSTGARVSYNDDISSANLDSRITVNLSAGARYYLGVTNGSSTSRGSYTWTINGPTPVVIVPDDVYENNDSQGTSYNLGTLTTSRTISNLKLVDTNDWYRFTTTTTGNANSFVSINFLQFQGDLQLGLYNSSGVPLASSATTSNGEGISLNNRSAGTYYVRVYGNAGATNASYSLTVTPGSSSTTPPPTTSGFSITLQMTGLTTNQQNVFNQAAARWSQVITGDLPNATYLGRVVDDVLIAASSVPIDGVNGILGQAGPDAFRTGSSLPYHGIMRFDSADIAAMEQDGSLLSVVLHEMGHVLGIGTLWSFFGLLSGSGTTNPTFRGPQAVAAYNQIFRTNATGVPVENTGGPGTREGHWRETLFTNELMTGWAGPGTFLPMSRVTVASLADMGYTVNIAMADPWVPTTTTVTSALSASSSSAASARMLLVGAPASETVTGSQRAWSELMAANSSSLSLRTQQRDALSLKTAFEPNRERLVDAVMTKASRIAEMLRREVSQLEDVFECDDPAAANDDAWDEFEVMLASWSRLATAS